MKYRNIRVLRFCVSIMQNGGLSAEALVLLLSSMPSDTALVGTSYDVQYNGYSLFFESSVFDPVLECDIPPSFVPKFKKCADGSIELLDNGLEL